MDDKIPILDFNSQLFLEKLKKELFGETKMETEKVETPKARGEGRARKIVLTEKQFLALVASAVGEDIEAIRVWQTKSPEKNLAQDFIKEFNLPKGTKVVDTASPRYIYFIYPDGSIEYIVEQDLLRDNPIFYSFKEEE